jgi:hypothetical protein
MTASSIAVAFVTAVSIHESTRLSPGYVRSARRLMTRKERKHKRKNKAVVKPKRAELGLALAMAKVMTASRKNEEFVNKKFYCRKCEMHYCLGFDGVDQFCHECPYNAKRPPEIDDSLPFGCQKETEGGRICQHCNH